MKSKHKRSLRLKVGGWIIRQAWDALQRIEIFLISGILWLVKKENHLDGSQSKEQWEPSKRTKTKSRISGYQKTIPKKRGGGVTRRKIKGGGK